MTSGSFCQLKYSFGNQRENIPANFVGQIRKLRSDSLSQEPKGGTNRLEKMVLFVGRLRGREPKPHYMFVARFIVLPKKSDR
jgi:hypothetical protein